MRWIPVYLIAAIVIAALLASQMHVDYTGTDDTIEIPVKVHLISDPSGIYTTQRGEQNVRDTFAEANRIWEQAGIRFAVSEIVTTDMDTNAVPAALTNNYDYLAASENFDSGIINAFFSGQLTVNGIALIPVNSIIVADRTTVNDYRTVAHEFGHLLGLRHVPDPNDLMSQGRNGESFSGKEIETARINAANMVTI